MYSELAEPNFGGLFMWTTKQCTHRKAKLFAALTVCLMLFAIGFAPGVTALGSNYVIVSDSSRYFQLEDGNDFLPLGYDQMPDFPESLYLVYPVNNPIYNKEALRTYFSKMHDHGVNTLRVWGEAPDYGYRYLLLENPAGVFNPAFAQFFDDVFELAEEYKIYILLTPYDTFWQHDKWLYYPYNYVNGGPCHSEGEGLTTDKGFEYEKARMKWFVDRYGNSDYLFGWDIMNEIDWTWGGVSGGVSAANIRTWTDRMSSWLIQYERQKWGKNHIITISTGTSVTGDLQYVVFQHPNLDFANTHMYDSPINNPLDVIGPAVKVNELVKLALSKFVSGDMRPYFDSESGPIDNGSLTDTFNNEYYHNMIWAHLASGGAGSDLRWPFRSGGPSEGMFDYVLAMSQIIKNIKWSKFASVNIDGNVTVTATGHTVIKMACGDTYTALVFVLQDSRSTTGNISGATMSVTNMQAGTYLVKYFNSYTGTLISSQSVAAVSGTVNVTLPDFIKDIVIILVNQSASPTVNRKPDAFLTSPLSGTGTGQVNSVTVSADAVCAGDTTVNHVDFYADYHNGVTRAWRLLNTDYTAPYTYQWNISSFPDQKAVEFQVNVYDNKGVSRTGMGLYNSGTTTDTKGGITLEHVSGDVTGGYGSIEFPPQNATINTSKMVKLKARAWDISRGVDTVKFWIKGTPGNPSNPTNTLLGEVSSPASLHTLDVDLSGYTDSSRWISIDVIDKCGNTVTWADLHSVLLRMRPDAQAVLLHRYSFTNGGGLTAVDSVGGQNGTLVNGATISNNAVNLDGINDYVSLPGGLITGLTALSFEAWFTCSSTSGTWTRVWDFGDTNSTSGAGRDYVFFAPKSGLGTFRYAISDADPGYNHENYIDAAPTPTGVPVYVACVQDDLDGTVKLYVNGQLVSSGKFLIPLSSVNNVLSYLGRSTYTADPRLKGSIDEFRIYSSVLTAEGVAEHYSAGPDAIGPFPVVIQETGGSTEVIEGNSTPDTYTVALASQPTNTVTLTVDPDEQLDIGNNGRGNPVNIVFDTNNWNSAQTVVVRAFDDDVLEADPHIGLIKHSILSSDPAFNNKPLPSVGVKIWDNECGAWGYNYSDLNYDCQVNFKDFAIFASYWLSSLNPITLDTFVSEWLETTQPYAPNAQYGPVQYPP
jgi:mannan endo-1,4-beta-mannosidase